MSSSSMLAIVCSIIFAFQAFQLVNAGLYVVDPRQGSTCHGGEACTVTWLDDGTAPLLSSIGLVNVGLYTGQQQLIQALEPVDVSAVRAFTFTPNPAAGPNSGAYYIGFQSVNSPNATETYHAYSPWFALDRMTGSFETPLPSATAPASISVSVSASSRPSTTSLSTITVGTLSSVSPTTTAISSSPSASSPDESSSPATPSSSPASSEPSASSALPSSSGFITSRTPSPTPNSSRQPASSSSSSSAPSEETSPAPEEDGSACSTPVSNRVAFFVTLFVVLAFFLL